MTTGADADVQTLRTAAEHRTRRDQLAAQAATAHRLVTQREGELGTLRENLKAETADVRRLERFSPAQVWGMLRGDLDDKLTVERGEQQAAAHAVDGATERLAHAQSDLDRIRAEIGALGDVDGAYVSALAAREGALRAAGAEAAGELVALETEAGARSAERRELVEATAALHRAQRALAEAQGALESAGGWSTYDTFFGGGMVADLVKHDRISASARAFAEVNRALESLSTELADIDAPPMQGVQISEMLGVFDVLFDNIFSDWAVRERITQAQHDAEALRLRLVGLGDYLAGRTGTTEARLAVLEARREHVILSAT